MEKKIGFIGNPAGLKYGSTDNTGNIIHGHAARAIFADIVNLKSQDTPENIEATQSSCSKIGFVAATMLHVNRVPKYIDGHVNAANFLEKVNLPVVTFGFGCQARLGQSIADAEVDERSVRLLRVISERAESIAVRGEFTAELCRKYGVQNVDVLGCQSCYVAGVRNYDSFPKGPYSARNPVAYLSLGPNESPILQLIMKEGANMIGQGNPLEEAIARGSLSREDFLSGNHAFWVWPTLDKAISSGKIGAEDYFDFVRTSFHKFYTVSEWVDHIRSYSFCFGTRFHGNMIAFHSGVPSLWLIHDMRTKELCEHLALPHIDHSAVTEETRLADLADWTDYSAFWSAFPARLGEFLGYLSRNDVTDLLKPEFLTSARAIAPAPR